MLAHLRTDPEFPLAVTMGDPAGIGPDIVIAAQCDATTAVLPRFAAWADPAVLHARARALGIEISIVEIAPDPEEVRRLPMTSLAVVPVSCPATVTPGNPDQANGQVVISCIEDATSAVATGNFSALVTAPISKATVYGAGFAYPGHTEFLATLAEQHMPGRTYTSVMMIASDELRVVPLTIHVPLSDVPALITRDLITNTLEIVADALHRDFDVARPRIAVAGLNPHAGEDGTIGREEQDTIIPAIQALRGRGFTIAGPLSGDTLFHTAARATYDAVICMYHDQALIPAKTLAFDTGVNVTLGLPFIRTSPDHGTAFNIAATGKANPSSFKAALHLARSLVAGRARHQS